MVGTTVRHQSAAGVVNYNAEECSCLFCL